MMWAKVEKGAIVKAGQRPRWFHDDGSPVGDERLIADGWLPIIDQRPDVDRRVVKLTRKPQDEWEIGKEAVTVTWEVDPLPKAEALEAVRKDGYRRIKRARDQHIASGISVGGVHVHTDDTSQQRLTGAALAATIDPEATINWKMADGQFATLSGTQIIGIAQAVREHVQAAFDTEAMLRAQINAAETIEEIDAVGWPDDP